MKKFTSILLLIAMLASLAACSNTDTTNKTTADTTGSVDTTAAETEETRAMHNLSEDLDFGGETFNIAYPEWQGYVYYFFADEATGDAMNDAIFQRTVSVEDYLNVDITQYNTGYINDVVTEAKKCINAGDDVYQLVLLHCITGVSELVSNGMLYNFDDLPNIDTSANWWNREQMDILQLGKNSYYGVSDYMIPCPSLIFFNKEMIINNGLENPYTLVYEGTWTLDTMVDMAISVTQDLDGDGQYTLNDICGITARGISEYNSIMLGCDQFMSDRDANGHIQLALNNEKTISIIESVYRLIENNGTLYLNDTAFPMDSGRLLFMLTTITYAETLRDCEIDVGMVPYPKYDEAQENYITHDWGGLMCIPTTIQNPEMVGAVLELLSWYSADTVIPAYYDVLLAGKLARDENSRAMIDILFDTIAYEVGINYFAFTSGFGDMYNPVNAVVIQNKSTDFASWYAKKETSAAATIETFYKSLDKIEG